MLVSTHRSRNLGFLLGLLCLALPCLQSQQTASPATPGPAAPLLAGPVYTRAAGSAAPATAAPPEYPQVDIVVPIAPPASASALTPSGWSAQTGTVSNLAPLTVRPFVDTGFGLSVILALDASGSMRGRTLQLIRGSVTKFVNDAGPQDRVAVMTFADEPRWDVDFTARPEAVRGAIDKLASRGHQTHLYDAMIVAIDRFEDAMPARRVLIVMSDGHDEGSQHTLNDVIAEAKSRRISVHTIGVTHSDPRYLESLRSVSEATGGTYAAANSDQQLDQLLSNGISGLKQTPVVTFRMPQTSAASIPLTIHWQPQQVTATVDVIPQAGSSARTPLLHFGKWNNIILAGAVALLLLVLAVIFWLVTRKHTGMPSDDPRHHDSYGVGEILPSPLPPVDHYQPHPPFTDHYAAPPPPVPAPPDLTEFEHPVPEPAPRPARVTRLAGVFDARPGEAPVQLEAIEGPLTGTVTPIASWPFTIGAAEGNTLCIPEDPSLSGFHAALTLESSILWVADRNSTNGTYLNGHHFRDERRSITPGDELRMGHSVFRVLRNPGA